MFLTLGEALIDLIPAPGEGLKEARSLTVQPGGAPLNVAIALKRLGVPVTFVGSLSTDSFGDRLVELLASEGIARIPQERLDAPTRLAIVDHAARADANFRFYGDSTADTMLSVCNVDNAFDPEPSGLFVTSLLLGHDQFSEVQHYAVERAIARGLPVFTDPNPRPPAWRDRAEMASAVQWLLASSTYVKLSVQDAHALGWDAEPVALIARLKQETPAHVIITDGERGSWAEVDGEVVHVEPPVVTPVDPTGAGDAFFGALIASVLETERLTVRSLLRASAAGALAVTSQGAVASIPTLSEIERVLTAWKPAEGH